MHPMHPSIFFISKYPPKTKISFVHTFATLCVHLCPPPAKTSLVNVLDKIVADAYERIVVYIPILVITEK